MLTHATIGNTIEFDIDIRNSDGDAVVLAGSTFTLNAISTDRAFSVVKSSGYGLTVDPVVTGRLNVTIDPSDTSELTAPKNLWWDLTMTDAFSDVRTVAKGRIALSRPIGDLIP